MTGIKAVIDTAYCKQTECMIHKLRYPAGQALALIIESLDGEPLMTASVNLVDEHLADNEVAIKDWSENEGIRECLEKLGVIGPVKRSVKTGFVTATIHECLI